MGLGNPEPHAAPALGVVRSVLRDIGLRVRGHSERSSPGPPLRPSLRPSLRHDVGARIVRAFAERHGFPAAQHRFDSEYASKSVLGHETGVLLPQTFMNRSGTAVAAALAALPDLDPTSGLLVVYDDLDLPFGRIRLRAQGRAGGQRGVQSIIDAVGSEDFARLRFGIGRPPEGRPAREYVLEPFDERESELLGPLVERAVDAIDVALEQGIDAAMDRFNRLEPVGETG